MSHPSPSVVLRHQSPSSQSQNLELEKQIERFQEAARALLAMYEPPEQGRDGVHAPLADASGEIRCYYLSPGTVRHERELLRRHHAEDFRGLLAETHMLLAGVVKLMKTTPHTVRVKGHVIASLGCLLEQAPALVLRMRNVYERVEPVTW